MRDEQKIETFWQSFATENGLMASYEAWSFGSNPEMADAILAEVLKGRKTATCSAKEFYQLEGENEPQADEYSVLLDGRDEPKAIIRTTKIETIPFDEVTSQHAFLEGEGDRSLDYWRKVHQEFFEKAYQTAGLNFHQKIPCLFEYFSLLYPLPSKH